MTSKWATTSWGLSTCQIRIFMLRLFSKLFSRIVLICLLRMLIYICMTQKGTVCGSLGRYIFLVESVSFKWKAFSFYMWTTNKQNLLFRMFTPPISQGWQCWARPLVEPWCIPKRSGCQRTGRGRAAEIDGEVDVETSSKVEEEGCL